MRKIVVTLLSLGTVLTACQADKLSTAPSISPTKPSFDAVVFNGAAKVAGDNQTAAAGAVVGPLDPTIRFTQGGVAVPAVDVTWTPSGDGSVNATTTQTNSAGESGVRWTLGSQIGAQTLRACASSADTPTAPQTCQTFSAQASQGSIVSYRFAILQGNNLEAPVSTTVPFNPTVQVRDLGGASIGAGFTVTFCTSGTSRVLVPSAVICYPLQTDVNGQAALPWQLGSTPGAYTLTVSATNTAPVNFTGYAVAVGGAAALTPVAITQNQTALTGAMLQYNPTLNVTGYNTVAAPTAAYTITYTASGDSKIVNPFNNTQTVSTISVTYLAGTGQVAVQYILGASPATKYTLTATAPGNVTATFIATTQGTAAITVADPRLASQTATVTSRAPLDPAVFVKDQNGAALPNVPVTFKLTNPTGACLNAGVVGFLGVPNQGTTVTVFTNVNGLAAIQETLSCKAGVSTLTASLASGASVSMTGTGTATTAAIVSKAAGDNQTVDQGTTLPNDAGVIVTDTFGNPVSGVSVTFAPNSGGTVSNGGTVITNAAGSAGVTWSLGVNSGTQQLTATVNAPAITGNPLTFTATARQVLTSIGIIQGQNQTAAPNATVAFDPTVRLLDKAGAAITTSTPVTFTASGTSKVVANPDVQTFTVNSNGLGQAAVTWRLGTTAGAYTLTVTSTLNGVTQTNVFNATAQ